MRRHPYLKAYMAGVLLPSWFLLVLLCAVLVAHSTGRLPSGLDAALIFPMAVVPNLWGLWNLLYIALGLNRRVPIGPFGALLPLILVPAGWVLAQTLGLQFYRFVHILMVLPVVAAIYYLAWKYAVAFFNRILALD